MLLSGCSTLGDIEAMNDVGLETPREAIHTYNTTMEVLGHGSPSNQAQAARINRGYGHATHMQTNPRTMHDVPFVVRDVQELFRYLRF